MEAAPGVNLVSCAYTVKNRFQSFAFSNSTCKVPLQLGVYRVTYSVTDSSGCSAQAVRYVRVVALIATSDAVGRCTLSSVDP
jgi:hypothetical protein